MIECMLTLFVVKLTVDSRFIVVQFVVLAIGRLQCLAARD